MTERLRRLEEVYARHPKFFLMTCTHKRRSILANDEIHNAFRLFCIKAMENHIFTGRYVLMPDHLHLFVSIEGTTALSKWVKSLKNTLSKQLNGSGESAPHWQKGFFDHVLRSAESYSEKWLYMVQNPVRAGFVGNWEDWRWQGEIYPPEYA